MVGTGGGRWVGGEGGAVVRRQSGPPLRSRQIPKNDAGQHISLSANPRHQVKWEDIAQSVPLMLAVHYTARGRSCWHDGRLRERLNSRHRP
jgi:hypothetical protein